MTRNIVQGAARFAIVSLAAWSVWAFGGSMSAAVLYTSIAAVFLALSGLLLYPLLEGSNRIARIYALFVPGFLLYALLWCLGWFGIGGQAGEITGSAAGLAALTFVLARGLGARGVFLPVLGVLFLCHTLGYTAGGLCYYAAYGKGILAPLLESKVTLGRLIWGLFYGLGFGAGLGFAFHFCQFGPSSR